MLQVGIIGCGNAGNQTVAEMYASDPSVPVLAINCSDSDMATIPEQIPRKVIGDGSGAGKNRQTAKNFLAPQIQELVADDQFSDKFSKLDVIFVVSSAGGGTGSGIAPLLCAILQTAFPNTYAYPIGIMPTLDEVEATQANALEYENEVTSLLKNPAYMLYDNGKAAKLGTVKMMEAVNQQIVKDIDVLRGRWNTLTKYASIDNRDGLNLITTPGRTMVAGVVDIKDKDLGETTIEEMMVDAIKKSYHVDIEYDKVVNRVGVVANLSDTLAANFNSHMPKVQELIGTPIEEFEHIAITPDRHLPNSVYVIITGLSPIRNRIQDIKDRIEDIRSRQPDPEEEYGQDASDLIRSINERRVYREHAETGKKVDLSGILSNFGVDVSKV